jgi:hypothetical protein
MMKMKLCILVAIGFSLVFLVAAKQATYEVLPVSNGGTITGKVTFTGQAPPAKEFLITKDTKVCGTGNRQIVEVDVGDDVALKNVVVYIEGIAQGKDWQKPEGGYLIDQTACRFLPHLTVVPKGESVTILSSDPVLHNIHTYELIGRARRTMFNEGQPYEGFKFTKAIKPRRGNVIKLECDVHDFMHAWMFVANNPYYAVIEKTATYTIPDVPPGVYEVKAWHPVLGIKTAKVSVTAAGTAEVSFEFTDTK